MRNLFNFLYYCIFRVFKLVKRAGVKDENLASYFFSILLSTNTIMIFFSLKFIIPKGFFTFNPYNLILKTILIAIFFGWYFICKNYFIKKEKSIGIINFYREKTNSKKSVCIGVLYIFFSFFMFATSGYLLSRVSWHI